jgi:hypothetical protein
VARLRGHPVAAVDVAARGGALLGVPWAAMHLFSQLPGQMNAGLDWWPTVISLLGYSVISVRLRLERRQRHHGRTGHAG